MGGAAAAAPPGLGDRVREQVRGAAEFADSAVGAAMGNCGEEGEG